MKRKKILSISIIIVFVVYIGASLMLVSKKPDISRISKAQQIAEYSKPAVVRIVSGALIQWKYTPDYDYYFYYLDSAIMEYLKAYDYKTLDLGAGSGTIINPNGYIITNAHVVEVAKLDNTQIIKREIAQMSVEISQLFSSKYGVNFKPEALATYLESHLKAEALEKVIKVILPGGGDFLDGEIKSYGAPVGEGKDVAVIKIEKTNLPSILLGDSEKVQLQSNVWVFGYPAAADSQLLSKESILVVSITDGKVSATDKKSTQGAPVLQINAAATHGNSGGPVINDDGNVVGLLTFRSENNSKETQGFNFVVPVNTVKEFVNQAGAKNEEGDINKLYKEGLQLYWAGYYKDALTKFEAVQRLNSNHSEIKKFISECQQKSSQSKILWSKYKSIAFATDGLAVLCIAALVYFGFFRKKEAVREENIANKEFEKNQESENIASSSTGANEDLINKPQLQKQSTGENIKAKLYVISGPIEGAVKEFGEGSIVIGRDPRLCNLVFPPDCIEIGRKHCIIAYNSEKQIFVLGDCSSTSGTFLGSGERIDSQSEKELKSGDSFYLGKKEYLFEVWLE
ncbi:trypsin-like peptidase domain-containing protein [Clostridium sp. CX1]|uniref:trypsin-like peptidase domain-containing protein n=1 Tax=Clostridium sp. CX1 TaxID=2978346 RepID=UPI0021BE2822|nr:trypsin-like peptidase domain-containing protein [Clostridium sp. CX1]MCT8975390.1 trypsin-like peptidase domain-containing protein [Clostridium sp. CX1]